MDKVNVGVLPKKRFPIPKFLLVDVAIATTKSLITVYFSDITKCLSFVKAKAYTGLPKNESFLGKRNNRR